MRGFVALLRALAGGRRLSARDLQPARAAFFVSLCWHVQRPEEWPAFHLPVRRALVRQGGLRPPSGDPAGDYLAFRERFLALTDTLAVGSWELEYLCRWQHTRAAEDGEEPYLYPSAPRSRRPSGMRVEPPLASVREPTGASPANAPAVLPAGATAPASAPRGEPLAGPGDDAPGERLGHTHVQWLLATLGRSLGCRVWVAPSVASSH